MPNIQNIQDLRDNYSVLNEYKYSDEEVVQWVADQTGETFQEVATYLGFSGQKSKLGYWQSTNSTPKDAYVTMSDRGLASTNSQEGTMASGQFFIEMIVGAFILMMIIKISKTHNLMWVPVVGFLAGYAVAQDASYAFSNVFGGLTFSLLCSFIAGVWIQRQKKKADNGE
jgi:hypothetical protein